MRLLSQVISLAIIGGIGVAGWWYLNQTEASVSEKTKRRGGATLVIAEPVRLSPDKFSVRAIGTGKALRSASLYPAASGAVTSVNFKAEQVVKAGQPLLRLENRDERLAVKLAQAAVNEAKRQAARLEKLAPSGNVARARLETARYELESAQLRLEQAQARLRDRTVYAPFTGTIGLTEIGLGDRVSSSTLIASLDDRSALIVEFDVAEDVAARIKSGDVVTLEAWTLPGRQFTATISATGSRIDAGTRTLTVQARIDNPDPALRPGTSFIVKMDVEGRRFPTVKEVAVLWSRDGAYVWRVGKGNKAEKVFLKIVRREKGLVLAEGSLAEGDKVIVEGVQRLRPDTKVRLSGARKKPKAKTKQNDEQTSRLPRAIDDRSIVS